MTRKILVVEDNWDFREIIATILHSCGYEVLVAQAASEGIEKAIREAPSLIIMDLGLPGVDGIEATAMLKRDPRTASIPVIAFTVWSSEFKDRALQAGMADFLPKTTPPQVFKEVIEKYV